ncbi:unnamed protein product, partial [Laminaria digitata]
CCTALHVGCGEATRCSTEMDALLQEVREEAWNGLIPAEFSMDSQEVTSLQRPLPLYLLLPRMGFLPCIAEAVSHHFGEVAPDAQRNLWLEETLSGEPLRWHIPTGVLFDLVAGREGETFDMFHTNREGYNNTTTHASAAPTTPAAAAASGTAAATASGTAAAAAAVAAKAASGTAAAAAAAGTAAGSAAAAVEPGGGNTVLSRSALPWKITVHFQGCPRRKVFPLEKEPDIRRHYTNALKQALYLQLGSSRAGMTLAKDKQTRLWRALKANDGKVFHKMDAFLGGDGGLRLVPVRLVMGDAPPSQLPIPTERPDAVPWDAATGISSTGIPVVGRREGGEIDKEGQGESRAVPSAEEGRQTEGGGEEQGEGGVPSLPLPPPSPLAGGFGVVREPMRLLPLLLPRVVVQGIDVPLDAPVAQLWGALRHPDHFLYVVVRKRDSG